MNRIAYLHYQITNNEDLYTDIKDLIGFHISTNHFYTIQDELIEIMYKMINDKTGGNLGLLKSENKILFDIFVYEYWH